MSISVVYQQVKHNMALPTFTEVQTLQFTNGSSLGVLVAAKSGILPNTLEYTNNTTLKGGVDYPASGEISVANKTWSTIKKIAGVVIAVIKKIGGVTP